MKLEVILKIEIIEKSILTIYICTWNDGKIKYFN